MRSFLALAIFAMGLGSASADGTLFYTDTNGNIQTMPCVPKAPGIDCLGLPIPPKHPPQVPRISIDHKRKLIIILK